MSEITGTIRATSPGRRILLGPRAPLFAVLLAAALLAAAAACRPGGPEETSRNWSGRYAVRVVGAATDCWGAESPPAMPGFFMELVHLRTGDVTIRMNPIVALAGRFRGDSLFARSKIQQPIALPDSIMRQTRAADSLDTITYRLRAAFAEDGFEGDYVVRAPDLRALVRRGAGARCDYRYGLRAARVGGPRMPAIDE